MLAAERAACSDERMHDPAEFRRLGHELVDLLADHLAEAQAADSDLPVLPAAAPRDARARWTGAPFPGGTNPSELWRDIVAHTHHIQHRRSVGHQVAPPTGVAALTDLLTSTLNNSSAIFEMGPVATAVESRIVEWMGARLGLPDDCGGVLTSGGSLGNLTALLAMRNLKRDADDSRPMAVLVGMQTHYCVDRALSILGMGNTLPVPVDERFRMHVPVLDVMKERSEIAGARVVGVVASACSTSTGAIDPLDEIADFCDDHDLWFHVDGAHGASFVLSDELRRRLPGIERADSVVWDAHKTLLVPSLVTGVLFRDGRHAAASVAPRAEYLFDNPDDDLDLGRRTLECTKPSLGLELYVTLATHGEAALAEYLDAMVARAAQFAERLRDTDDFELLTWPDANIVCFRHTPGGVQGEALDDLQRTLRERVVAGGRYYLTRTYLRNAQWLRCTLLNPATTDADLRGLLEALRAAVPG